MRTSFSPISLAVPPAIDPPAWGFPYHTACWRVMTEVCVDGGPDPQLLFDLCRSFPVQLGITNWGRDYGGSICYEERPSGLAPGEEAQILGPVSNAIYQHDPLEIPEIHHVFKSRSEVESGPDPPNPPHVTQGTLGYRDGFSQLPTEILQDILTYLPTTDVGSLRRASRIYADLPLHDQFWKSRFRTGYEFAFVFEADRFSSLTKGRWESVYFSVKDLCRTASVTNRSRVWFLASSLWGLLSLASEASCDESALETLPSNHRVRWVTASRALVPLEKASPLDQGCFTNE